MRFWKRTPDRRINDEGTSARVPQDRADADRNALLEAVVASLAPLASEFAAVADEAGVDVAAEAALDRLFAFNVLLRGAREQAWRGFACFTINESIPRRDTQNESLERIQIETLPWQRTFQVESNRWAMAEFGAYLAALPDDWFRFRLTSRQWTLANGVRSNCVHQLGYAVVALTSFDFAEDADVKALYLSVEPLVPIKSVLTLAR